MNVIFLTLADIRTVENDGIYQDLMREFAQNGHNVYVVSPTERRDRQKTAVKQDKFATILRVKIGNIKNTNLIEKGISTLKLEGQFIRAIKKFLKGVKFDLVLYSTPPITFEKVVKFIKKRDEALSYLLLKDIFPQNAVDLGMLKTSGLKGCIYKFFRKKEKKLYAVSDYIGCMSQANVDYVLEHNPEVSEDKVEICPNSIEAKVETVSEEAVIEIRKKYGIPLDKTVFVYGGNLGKPQGIPFIIDCLKCQKDNEDVFFVIVGNGTEYHLLEDYYKTSGQQNLMVMQSLPKEDFDVLVQSCDVGIIFLEHRFTIPNFPSRLLSYMQAQLPVLACTDPNTDVGKVIVEHGFGWWCESNDVTKFDECVKRAVSEHREKAANSTQLLYSEYSVSYCYKIITDKTVSKS